MPAAVSVLIPTFNRADVIGGAVDSVLAQTHKDLEIIIVDDGSSDGTRQLLAEAYGADPRVRYHYQPNGGLASARNGGIALATGEYIALLDSDDSWKPWHLELLMASLDRFPEAGLIWTDLDAVDGAGAVIATEYLATLLSAYKYFSRAELFTTSLPLSDLGIEIPPEYRDRRLYAGDVFSPMVMGNLIPPSSVVIRRERLDEVGRFDESFVSEADYEFLLRVCRAGPVAFADVADIRYRMGTTDQLSGPAGGPTIARAYLRVLEETLARDADRITLSPAMIIEARAYAHRWLGEAELQAGSRGVARAHLATAFGLGPRRSWTAFLLVVTFLPSWAIARMIDWRRRLRRILRRARATMG